MVSSMEQEEKIRENRLRRMAERQQLKLVKSRRRDSRAWDYGTYDLIDPNTNTQAIPSVAQQGYGHSPDDIERWLTSDRSPGNDRY